MFDYKNGRLLAVCFSASALVISGCGANENAASTDELPGLAIEGLDDDLIRAAAEEGEVFLRTGGHSPAVLERVEADMSELFGIEVVSAREGSGDVYSSVQAELASGNVQTDVVGLADGTAYEQLASEGAVGDSEVPNRDQIMPEFDDGSTPYVPMSLSAAGVLYNTASTDEADLPSTWEDFFESDLRVLTANPSASGTTLSFYSSMLEERPSFIEDVGGMNPSVTDSALSLAQMVLTGEVDIAIPSVESEVVALAAEGEPVATKFLEGPVPTTVTYIGTLAEAPNPNAAKLMAQYHLTEEFQTSMADAGRPILQDIELGPAVEDLSDRYAIVRPETVQQFGDAARSTFTEEVN